MLFQQLRKLLTVLKWQLSAHAYLGAVCLFILGFCLGIALNNGNNKNYTQFVRQTAFTIRPTQETTIRRESEIVLPSQVQKRTDPLKPLPGERISERWIVITSVQPPTDDVKMLAKFDQAGWRVLVVGDKKAPPNWECPGVRFLSYDEMTTKLGYNLLAYQRWNTFAAKNIGFLFAIQHGAKIIYDTDDDNRPTDNVKSMLELAGYTENGTKVDSIRSLVWNTRNFSNPSIPVINALPHFGQSSLWPRGHPLTEIARPNPRDYKMCKTRAPSWIQGVVNGDPDVDAIFRLTRKHFNTRVNLTFDHAPPVIIPQGFLVQSNAQNTLFTEESLSFTLLPFSESISPRETDIWRGYIGQPLLWQVGGRKAYVSPCAFQARNPHDYMWDFDKESNLYKRAGELTTFLSKWQCPPELDLGECFVKIYEDLAGVPLIADSFDVEAARAWISDLRRMQYKFPERRVVNDCLDNEDERAVKFYPIEQPIPLPAQADLKLAYSTHPASRDRSTILPKLVDPSRVIAPDMAVMVIFVGQSEPLPVIIERLDILYAPYFARTIFCTSVEAVTKGLTHLRVTAVQADSGFDCLKQLLDLRLKTSTFVVLAIDERAPLALLSPAGVDLVANSSKADILAGACDKVLGPLVVVAPNRMISSLTKSSWMQLCDTASTRDTIKSGSCLFAPSSAAILSNCPALSGDTWTPVFA